MNGKAALVCLFLLAASPCLRAQKAPSLDRYDQETRQSLELTCLLSKTEGPAAYGTCLNEHIAALRASPPVPDLSKLDDATRQSLLQACILEKRRGPALYARCLNGKIAASRGSPEAPSLPSLAALDPQTRAAIERACIVEKTQGAAAYAGCVRKKLERTGIARDDISSRRANLGRAPAFPLLQWSGVQKPEMPSQMRSGASAPDALFAVLEKSVYVLLSGPTLDIVKGGRAKQGSAVAISSRVALTNCHVLEGNRFHFLVKDRTLFAATLSYGDESSDRCAVEVRSTALSPIQGIRRYSTLAVGERVYTVGSPSGMENTLSEGILSGLRRRDGLDLVQISAPISPGSSGGGVFDGAGNLIGITTFHLRDTQNLNFAIAADAYWASR
jgi:S1-C subfamily serine protease